MLARHHQDDITLTCLGSGIPELNLNLPLLLGGSSQLDPVVRDHHLQATFGRGTTLVWGTRLTMVSILPADLPTKVPKLLVNIPSQWG